MLEGFGVANGGLGKQVSQKAAANPTATPSGEQREIEEPEFVGLPDHIEAPNVFLTAADDRVLGVGIELVKAAVLDCDC